MSRIGRKPIPLPKGVQVEVRQDSVIIKGPKGSLDVRLMPGISAEVDGGELRVSRSSDDRRTRAFHGLCRALMANAVVGVTEGWKKELEIVGIGYRAEKKGDTVVLNMGYSRPVNFKIPPDVEVDVDTKANRITVRGVDRQRVGQVAAQIRSVRPPEPYKGKGIRYVGETVTIKPGKAGAKS